MEHWDEKPIFPTGERLHAELRRLDWAKGLSEETFAAITNMAEWVEFFTPGTWSSKSNQKLAMRASSSRAGCTDHSTILWARRFRRIPLSEDLWLDCLPSVYRIAPTCESRLTSLRRQYDVNGCKVTPSPIYIVLVT
jgi:hypothetical protein